MGQIQPYSERWQLENYFKDQMLYKKVYFSANPTENSHLGFVTVSELNVSAFCPVETSYPSLSLLSASKNPLLGTT